MTTLEEIAQASDTILKINQFTHINGSQWYICKLTDRTGLAVCVLYGTQRRIVIGIGPAPEEARAAYAMQIKGKTLSIDQFFDTRTYQVPDDIIP